MTNYSNNYVWSMTATPLFNGINAFTKKKKKKKCAVKFFEKGMTLHLRKFRGSKKSKV